MISAGTMETNFEALEKKKRERFLFLEQKSSLIYFLIGQHLVKNSYLQYIKTSFF